MESIRDKVAIVGMGCSKFGERWDMGLNDLAIESAYEAIEDAGIETKDIQACFLGTVLHSLCWPAIYDRMSNRKLLTTVQFCGILCSASYLAVQ